MRATLPLALLAATALAACAGLGGPPPKRPAVAVADEVGPVQTAAFVGSWTCRELNPYPEMAKMRRTMSFTADGTGSSQAEAEPGEPNAPLGGMKATSSFKWRAEGTTLVMSDVKVGLGDQPDDALTSAIMSVASVFAPKESDLRGPHASEVLQLSSDRFVIRGVGIDDPPVIDCAR